MARIDWSQMMTPEKREAIAQAEQEAAPISRAQLRKVWKALGRDEAELADLLDRN